MKCIISAMVICISGCASAGGGGGGVEASSIPIYMAVTDVPCAYQTIENVRGFVTYSTLREYERERDVVLRRAAARAGAEAVLIPENRQEPGRGNVGVSVQRRGGVTVPSETSVEGIAIRLTC